MEKVNIGLVEISRFILGSNPISGFSHQSPEAGSRMRHYFTSTQIKRLWRDAESLGVTALIGRVDHHMCRMLMEYWDEGGKLQWIAQAAAEAGSLDRTIQEAIFYGASACYVHGGVVDHYLANGRLDELPPLIKLIRDAGLPAGIAGHNPEVFRWADKELDVDFFMCSYYNPMSRDQSPEHEASVHEWFRNEDRDIMAGVISGLSRPVIHYKVMAAGRNNPAEAFAFVKKHMRPEDAVCVGIYDEDQPGMLASNVELFNGAG